ncbi:MAG: hypothetical protein JRF59_10495 [Deltaproteobacteria bacterium]|nr:hypothetical protein [Deltaproteobacteria bacterium]MBW1924136.1 hypothetical protein [Deltaproteobacteria bacterium]MBW1950077.1 hypothetical protein [Deltaproteobacteria bacterium]MBW2009324.1 hypothetical protein [Deltaproteobacteria bacterium]MBW2102257.1 hypothetical protein [Deltaproteobacteria bacterium]
MAKMTQEQVEEALKAFQMAPMVRYDQKKDAFTITSVFFKALGRIGAETMAERIKKALPHATVSRVWTSAAGRDTQCGYECVEFRV